MTTPAPPNWPTALDAAEAAEQLADLMVAAGASTLEDLVARPDQSCRMKPGCRGRHRRPGWTPPPSPDPAATPQPADTQAALFT